MKSLLVALLILLSARPASAHETGLSRGEYSAVGAVVTATLTFARGDVPSATADTIARGLLVRGDEGNCPTTIESATPVENDGTQLVVRATCRSTPRIVVVEAFFLSELPFGHRHLARAPGVDASLTLSKRTISFAPTAPPPRGRISLLLLGIEHILTGPDHLVFLLGLIIVGATARELFAVITAFTVGHSISLALATLGVWVPSARVVEPLIALSIVYIGLENLRGPRKRWRVTLPFGLVHGFGFASALRDLWLPRSELPAALALFNVGVELGQLAVLAVLVPIVLRTKPSPRVVRDISLAIVLAGFAWFAVRVLSSSR